jgi:hypothetical protein
LCLLLFFRVGKVSEVAAHQPPWRFPVPGAGFMIYIGDLLEPAEAYCSGKWRYDQPTSKPRSKLDRRLGERPDIGGDWLLHRFRGDAHVVERVVLAMMRYPSLRRPQRTNKLQTPLEYALIVFERNTER